MNEIPATCTKSSWAFGDRRVEIQRFGVSTGDGSSHQVRCQNFSFNGHPIEVARIEELLRKVEEPAVSIVVLHFKDPAGVVVVEFRINQFDVHLQTVDYKSRVVSHGPVDADGRVRKHVDHHIDVIFADTHGRQFCT